MAANEDQQHRLQRWQLWPLLLGLMHHGPECAQAAYDPSQEAVSDTLSCLSVCAEAFAAAAPWQEADEASALLRACMSLTLRSCIMQSCCQLELH